MQLVAYGAQDIYLTGNPQITFFKVVYRRHTNFAMESIEQTFNGAVAFGTRVTATISRNGDLIKDMWLEVFFNDATNRCYGLGNALVKQVEVEIGGQLIDRQYGEWMDIWSELSIPEGKRAGYDEMVSNVGTLQKVDVPLMFWFNRNPGLALPLIALQYHEVKINLDLAQVTDVFNTPNKTPTLDVKLWVDYIYLDTDERRRFAQVSHEYLIEQLQFTGDASIATGDTNFRTELNFNHPCKELIWVYQANTSGGSDPDYSRRGGSAGYIQPCKFLPLHSDTAATGAEPTAILKLNGQDRFQERRMQYFYRVQNYKHHTHSARAAKQQYIYLYSFALNPEEHQPSGTCNFSRIDNTVLSFRNLNATGAPVYAGIVKVFAVNYNVLRIMSGMGGLAYSN